MKKGIIITVLVLAVLAAVGYGISNKNDTESGSLVSGVEVTNNNKTDALTQEDNEMSNFAENADEKIDMKKIEGTEAKSDSSGKKGDGKMTNCTVKIENVKISEVNGVKTAFVVYEIKNTSSSNITFIGDVYVEAYQDGMELPPAVFENDIEGYSPDSATQQIKPGETINVQRAFTLIDDSAAIELYVRDSYDSSGKESLAQVFKIK